LDRDSLRAAAEAGATLATHLGNGAHDQLQRHNNYLWYQLAEERIYASFIADNQHLPQECLYSMLRAKGMERSVLVSDSVLLGGMKPGVYWVRGHEIEMLESGRIVVPGTPNLAGSGSNLLECVQYAVTEGKVTHEQAWAMGSTNPAHLLSLEGRLGLEPGCEASLTLYRCAEEGAQVEVVETWVAGRKVFDSATGERLVMPDVPPDASPSV
jgi:N-acetylglucosamine-6-phosphate deacetylase